MNKDSHLGPNILIHHVYQIMQEITHSLFHNLPKCQGQISTNEIKPNSKNLMS